MEDTNTGSLLKHYCNVTFRTVGDMGPDGHVIERLLRCSKCKDTYYCGRAEQVKHWRMHKQFCRPVEDEPVTEEEINLNYRNLSMCARGFSRHFNQNYDGSPNSEILLRVLGRCILARGTWYMLKRMQTLCIGSGGYSVTKYDLRDMGQLLGLLEIILGQADDSTISALWAVPGMATFMLNIDLISKTMRQKKQRGIFPSKKEMKFKGFDPAFQNHMYFSTTIGNIMMASVFQMNFNQGPVHRVRNTGLAQALSRKMFEWYKDPHTLISIPYHLNKEDLELLVGRDIPDRKVLVDRFNSLRTFHLPKLFGYLAKSAPFPNLVAKNEVIPGLTVADGYRLVTHDSTNFIEGIGALSQLAEIFLPTTKTVPAAWQAFSVEDRVDAVDKVIKAFRIRDPTVHDDDDVTLVGTLFLSAAIGLDTPLTLRDDAIFLKVVKLGKRTTFDDDTATPWAANADFFNAYYNKAYNPCVMSFGSLINGLLRYHNGFTEALIPYDAVCEHIIEFAMENMGAYDERWWKFQKELGKKKGKKTWKKK